MALWKVEVEDGVAIAAYEYPPMNYFCGPGTLELVALTQQWRAPEIRAVVLTGGVPGRFITHYSVEELVGLAEHRDLVRTGGTGGNHAYHEMLRGLRDLPKPVIAAMSGDTMGGGFELSLACDIRIAERGDYRIGLPEVLLGILPGGSGTQRLARLLGAGRAVDFMLRGRIVRPEEALDLGLVHELADDAAARARELAASLARLSPVAIAEIKRAVYEGSELHLSAGLRLEAEGFTATMLTDEALASMREYVSQPLEKRRDWLEQRSPAPKRS